MYKQVLVDMLNTNETRFMKYLFQGSIKYWDSKYMDNFDRDKLVPEVNKVIAIPYRKIPWNFHGLSIVFHGFDRNSMENEWNSMVIHGTL